VKKGGHFMINTLKVTSVLIFCCVLSGLACSDSSPSNGPASPNDGLQLRSDLKPDTVRPNVINMLQAKAPTVMESFVIPDVDSFVTEYLQGDENLPLLDILVVVDNSGSMSEEQAKLAEKVRPLLSQVRMTDWQINVISTDSPCSTRDYLPMTAELPDMEKQFENAIKIGTSGSATEKPLQMAAMNLNLEGTCGPKKWLRDGAKLAIFFLTDEDERPVSTQTPVSFIQLLQEKGFIVGRTAKIYSIMTHPSKPCSTASDAPGGAPILAELMDKAQGMWGDICAGDYSKILNDFSADIAKLFGMDIKLGGIPVKGTLEVSLNGKEGFEGYMIVGDAFVLLEALDPGSKLVIKYSSSAITMLKLRNDIRPAHIQVKIDGESMTSESFFYWPKDGAVHFFNPLPGGAKVEIEYADASYLQTTFRFPVLASAEGVSCFADDLTAPSIYVPGDDFILIDPPPPSESSITCMYPAP
jgi:hypothetical protein